MCAVIGIVGPSGAGKTALLEQLVAALAAHGLVVGCVKHSSHAVEVDRPGKDSARHYAAGAAAVALAMPGQLATFRRLAPDAPRLAVALASLPQGLDVILVPAGGKSGLNPLDLDQALELFDVRDGQ